ncbi:carbohydrate ABC transporter permease [Dictyobacter arantiisoli]|uniref:ABC transporter permease n=1 Tax=Dictyobacter arantiisoli TaxID=2014874 RepID=A0A5A5TGE6_9CHLR|nr:sugar ABC transporter permease [Dictyobacter arantiisoli]GCF10315.1 ABC transporter permease [Dictyobacter arantiisoli]
MATQVVRQIHKSAQTPSHSWRDRLPGQGQWTPYLFVLPTLILILVIAIYPMLDSIHISLLNNPLIAHPRFVGLRNYGRILIDPVFQLAFKTTLIFAVCSVVLETIFGLGIALLINQTFPGRGLVRTVILVPWAFPTVVSAQMWLLMYNDQTGVITYLLQMFHLLGPGTTLLGTSAGVIFASVITDVWKTTPFMALLILAGLQVIPTEMYEASDVDGTTRWQRFFYITLPLLKRPLMIALLFRALDAIRVFDLFYVFGLRSVPSLASYANLKMFAGTAYDFAPGVAVAVIVFLIGIVVSLLLVPMMRDNT